MNGSARERGSGAAAPPGAPPPPPPVAPPSLAVPPLPPQPPPLQQQQRVLEASLTRLTVGMWASRRHRECRLLILPDQRLLVVLCDRRQAAPRMSPSRFSLAGMQLAVKSPFSTGHDAYRSTGCVHAFEIPYANRGICGLDYSAPLCLEARLVLETHSLRKREFGTVRRVASVGELQRRCGRRP